MYRLSCTPRPNFKAKVEELGLVWHSLDTEYWHESAYYTFSSREVEMLERATEELHQMYIAAADYAIQNNMLTSHFDIPEQFVPAVVDAWNNEPPALNFGRFDLGFDGVNPPKLFEYNCDTPTSLLEAAVIQWQWKEETHPFSDQFNSIHEKMVAAYRKLPMKEIMFASVLDNLGEDAVTLAYHMDLATEAGKTAYRTHMEDIGVDENGQFVDLEDENIDTLFKLYPWEWLVNEQFAENILTSDTVYLEPIWKMIWSNKAILPILWKLYPNHQYLLESSFEPLNGDYVVKPTLAREGANVTIHRGSETITSEGDYGDGRMIYQRLYNLPQFDGRYPVIGSWCVDGYAAGIGIRDGGLITNNQTMFTPHIISGF